MISLDYLAGLIDADGYIGVIYNKSQNWYNLRITITNTDMNVLLLIQKDFRGNIHYKHFNNPNHRNQFIIQWSGKDVLNLLSKLEDKLIIKNDQCKLALTFPMGINTDKNRQNEIYNKLAELKRKIYDAPEYMKNCTKNRHEEKLQKIKMAKDLKKQNLSQSEIGRKIGVSQEMVSKYLNNGT